jgi:drug/metabolite transporter (DMT)-like permease
MMGFSLPVVAIGASALLWGIWWIPLRWLGGLGLDSLPLNALLYGAGAVILLPFVLRKGGLRKRPPLVLASGIALGFALIAWNLALLHGEVVRATLLFYLSVVWASLMEWVVLHRRMRAVRVVAIALGLGGAWVLLGGDGGPPIPRGIGDWFGIVSGLLFAIAVTMASVTEDLDSREQTCVAFVTAALIGLGATLALRGDMSSPVADPALYGAVILVAIVFLVPTCLLLFWGARTLPPGRVSLLMLLEVVAAAVSASSLAGEPFTFKEAAGCALIMAAGLLEGFFPDPEAMRPLA